MRELIKFFLNFLEKKVEEELRDMDYFKYGSQKFNDFEMIKEAFIEDVKDIIKDSLSKKHLKTFKNTYQKHLTLKMSPTEDHNTNNLPPFEHYSENLQIILYKTNENFIFEFDLYDTYTIKKVFLIHSRKTVANLLLSEKENLENEITIKLEQSIKKLNKEFQVMENGK